ncbi:MAG: hypothetical protein H5T99_12325, partial [Moorella sp. (in: Bacteria)]|nr:hypothetical protein [Moorella sp. (in: firmicutes)]
MRESIFSFWEDQEFNALADKSLTAADNAWQARMGEEESWFWEASNKAGAYLNITFTACGKAGKASLFLVQPSMEAVRREAAAPFTASRDKLEVQLDGKRIYQEGELFRLEWQSEDLGVELEFQPLLPGWQPGNGRVDFGEKGDKYLIWSVPVPRARVNGNLVIAGRETAFSGTGYVDHR